MKPTFYKFSRFALILSLFTLPQISSAASYCKDYSDTLNSNGSSIADILKFVTCLISNSVIPLFFALAIVVFLWGMVKFIQNANDSTEREQGRTFMIWGIVALFVMVSVWGIVKVFTTSLGISNVIPQLPVSSGE